MCKSAKHSGKDLQFFILWEQMLGHFYSAVWNCFVVSVSRQLNSAGGHASQCSSEVNNYVHCQSCSASLTLLDCEV